MKKIFKTATIILIKNKNTVLNKNVEYWLEVHKKCMAMWHIRQSNEHITKGLATTCRYRFNSSASKPQVTFTQGPKDLSYHCPHLLWNCSYTASWVYGVVPKRSVYMAVVSAGNYFNTALSSVSHVKKYKPNTKPIYRYKRKWLISKGYKLYNWHQLETNMKMENSIVQACEPQRKNYDWK